MEKIDKPILLKRGMSATVEEWLMSAEYILAGGNIKDYILCEQAFVLFGQSIFSRNTLDFECSSNIEKLNSLPIVVDPESWYWSPS